MIPLLVLAAAPAHALDFRWWGVGPELGTLLFPLKYPVAFPTVAVDDDDQPFVDYVEGDLDVGAHAVLYVGNVGRVGLRGTLGFNFQGWDSQQVTLEWDQLLVRDRELQLLLGVGVGIGHEAFRPDSADFPKLDVAYYPLRAQIGGLLRDGWRAYQVDIYGTWHIAGGTSLYADADAEVQEAAAGSDFFKNLGFYAGMGVEATVFFGNFRNAKAPTAPP